MKRHLRNVEVNIVVKTHQCYYFGNKHLNLSFMKQNLVRKSNSTVNDGLLKIHQENIH